VVIYPDRNTEQSNFYPYRALLDSEQVHRVYLKELGNIEELPLDVALMVLTIVEENNASVAARRLLTRTREQIREPETGRAIIEIITTIMVYRFTNLSRQEVTRMLGIELKDTRVYREAKEEGRLEEAVNLVLRQLSRRCGVLTEAIRQRVAGLPMVALEELSEALLDFTGIADLESWLENHP
jgi:predicted transposase YdaD